MSRVADVPGENALTIVAAEGSRVISRTHYAAQAIAEAIFTGVLRPGAQVGEQEWAERLEVSRIPVREALRKLETEGLVEIRPRRGAFVARMEKTEFTEVYDVRALLEGFAARLCAQSITHRSLEQMEDVLLEMREAAASAEVDRYGSLSVAFLELVWESVHNRVVRDLIRRLWRRSLRLRLISMRLPGYVENSLASHEHLLDALRHRDPAAAEMVRWLHVQRSKRALLNGYYGRPDQRAVLEQDLPPLGDLKALLLDAERPSGRARRP
jgi:DNA-binding GntR family transcriptional regulator